MDGVFRFFASRNGRIARVVVGAILIVLGLAIGFNTGSLLGWVLTVIGIFPVAAGVFDLCLFAPFFGKALKGSELREQVGPKTGS